MLASPAKPCTRKGHPANAMAPRCSPAMQPPLSPVLVSRLLVAQLQLPLDLLLPFRRHALPPLHPPLQMCLRHGSPQRIPGSCRRGVAACLTSLIFAFVTDHSWEAFHRLQCFPKLVLRAPKRAGKKHAKQLALDISRRLRLFEMGQLPALWTEAMTVVQCEKSSRTRAHMRDQECALPKLRASGRVAHRP